MKEKITFIVLGTVHHSDTTDILTLYSREYGRLSVTSRTGAGRSAAMRRAILQPLSVLSGEVDFRRDRELNRLGAISVVNPLRGIRTDPAKNCTSLFIAEFLSRLLRETEADTRLFDGLLSRLEYFSVMRRGAANFHLALLIELLEPAGIRPDIHRRPDQIWFDMREGKFSASPPLHADFLPPAEGAQLSVLIRMTARNCRLYRFDGAARRHLLSRLLQYYSCHLPGTSTMRSPDILRQIFG